MGLRRSDPALRLLRRINRALRASGASRRNLAGHGELVSNRRHRLFEAQAELRNEQNLVLATAKGKYLPLKDQEMNEALADFDGDTGGFFVEPERTGYLKSRLKRFRSRTLPSTNASWARALL